MVNKNTSDTLILRQKQVPVFCNKIVDKSQFRTILKININVLCRRFNNSQILSTIQDRCI